MHTRIAFAASALLLGATSVAWASAQPRGEAELSEMLHGRAVGAPVNCLRLQSIRSSRVITATAIVFTTSDGTIYVNRPSGARALSAWDVPVIRTTTSQLCSIDIVRLHDPSHAATTSFVSLAEFVPFRPTAN